MIGFYIKKLSDFQYLSPLNKFIVSNNIKTKFFSNKKYVFKKTYPLEKIFTSKLTHLFSVDCDFPVDLDLSKRKFKHIIIQNYHDFAFSAQLNETKHFYENCDLFWAENISFAKILKQLGNFEIINGITPNYWRYAKNVKEEILEQYSKYIDDEEKIAVCFLPKGKPFEISYVKDLLKTPEKEIFKSGTMLKYINHSMLFGKFLEEKGYSVLYKQRPKDRFNISVRNHIVSDNLCPNEAMDLAYISKFGYGYMTSALMYYLNFNKLYFNFENKNYPKILKDMFNVSLRKDVMNKSIEDKFEDLFSIIESFSKKDYLPRKVKRIKNSLLEIIQ